VLAKGRKDRNDPCVEFQLSIGSVATASFVTRQVAFRQRRAPLTHQKRTCARNYGMSALCHRNRHRAVHSIASSANNRNSRGITSPSSFAVFQIKDEL
jgi:hypothetical protein